MKSINKKYSLITNHYSLTTNLTDIRQTPQYASFMKKLGWFVEKINNQTIEQSNNRTIYIYIKKLPFLPFSVAKILRCSKVPDYKQLLKIKNKYHCLFIKIHPFTIPNQNNSQLDNLAIGKLKEDYNPLIPTKTIWLDLTKSKKNLLSEMKPKTRYNINKSQKSNLKFQIITGDQITNQQLQHFYNLWKKNKPHNWLFKPSFKELKTLVDSFLDKCFFVFCHSQFSILNSQLIAGALILCSSNMSFYWHNCSSMEGKTRFTPTLCIWQAILESKKRSLQIFDLEGIWDKRLPNKFKGWKGFSRFKKGFGGKEITFIPPLIIR